MGFIVAPCPYLIQIIPEAEISLVSGMFQTAERVMPEDAVSKLSPVNGTFAGCQLPVVDEVVEFLQERLEFTDKRVEMGATVKFRQPVVTEKMIEGVYEKVICPVKSGFRSLLYYVYKILGNFIQSARCLREFSKLGTNFLNYFLREAVQVEVYAALLIIT